MSGTSIESLHALFQDTLEMLSSAYLAILDYLREIVRHARRVADRFPPAHAR